MAVEPKRAVPSPAEVAELALDAQRRARPREARHAQGASYVASPIATRAKCQAHVVGCTALVDVTQAALDALQAWDRILARRGEPPLDLNACFPCEPCRIKRVEESDRRCSVRRERTAETIRYVRNIALDDLNRAFEWRALAGHVPSRASDTVAKTIERLAWLAKTHGDSYVVDLVTALRDKARAGTGQRKPRREDL